MDKGKAIAILVAVIACALLIAGLTGFVCYKAGQRHAPEGQKDTVVTVVTIRDTITQYKPEYITKKVVEKVLVPVTDTLQIHDTTFIEMEVEQKVYADSNYRAVVSGIRPSLDEISVYPETKIITQTITVYKDRKPTRFGVGCQVGFGACYGVVNKKVDAGPYIGLGISYNFIRF